MTERAYDEISSRNGPKAGYSRPKNKAFTALLHSLPMAPVLLV